MSRAEGVARDGCVVPDGLESARAKLIYLYLSVRREASLEELAEDLDLPLITLCDLLGTLEERGHVTRDADRYRSV